MDLWVDSLANFVALYLLVLLLRVIWSWVPTVNWENPVLSVMRQLTDPYIACFRAVIPPIAGMDLSASFAILALAIVQNVLDRIAGIGYSF
ncbi:YggT family protein [Leptolyngbya sp. BL0902]|uniref:YggT family protein n=1 Tax=Leptolyngbya sp. BL0902 TaxID=1115757 RepID=UPI0018E70E2A|nr:YggT family protein [Leptolyngbya sp. BL0902]QQE64183.1 YggT family protein [Leptolyngbya sp. BL0902]